MLDLNPEQKNGRSTRHYDITAKIQSEVEHRTEPTRPSGPYIRRARDSMQGLLLIYPLGEMDTETASVRRVCGKLSGSRQRHTY